MKQEDDQKLHKRLLSMGFHLPDGRRSYRRNIVRYCGLCKSTQQHMQIYRHGYGEGDWFTCCYGCSLRRSGGVHGYMRRHNVGGDAHKKIRKRDGAHFLWKFRFSTFDNQKTNNQHQHQSTSIRKKYGKSGS